MTISSNLLAINLAESSTLNALECPLHWGWRWKGLWCVRCSETAFQHLVTRDLLISRSGWMFVSMDQHLWFSRCWFITIIKRMFHIFTVWFCFHIFLGSWVMSHSLPILPALTEDWWVDGSNLQEHPGRHLAHRGIRWHVLACQLPEVVERLPEV